MKACRDCKALSLKKTRLSNLTLVYSAIFFAFGLGINIVIDTDTLFYVVNMLSHTAETGKKIILWSVQH